MVLFKEMMGIREDIERKFVEAFVQPKRRERSSFELGSKKKRRDFFVKLCHGYMDILDHRFMVQIPPPNSDPGMILRLMEERGAGTDCYVMSYHTERDGDTKKLSQALEEGVGNGMAIVIVSDPEKLAYFEAEQELGPPPRFLLERKR